MAGVLIDPLGDASNLPDEICIHILLQMSCFELQNLLAVNKRYQNLVSVCFESRRNILRTTIAQIHSTAKEWKWNQEQPVPWNLTPEIIDRIVDTRFTIFRNTDRDYDDEGDLIPIHCNVCHKKCNFVPVVTTLDYHYHFCFQCVSGNLIGVLKTFTPPSLLSYAQAYDMMRIMSGMRGLRYN